MRGSQTCTADKIATGIDVNLHCEILIDPQKDQYTIPESTGCSKDKALISKATGMDANLLTVNLLTGMDVLESTSCSKDKAESTQLDDGARRERVC